MPSVQSAVSVLLPVRNGRETLRRALLDLTAALEPQDEILVVDDGSQDETPRLLQDLSASEPRLRVIRTDGMGLVGALNLGLREVSHRWVARADSDDRYPQRRISQQRAAARPGVVLVSGDYRIMSRGSKVGDLPSAVTSPFVVASLIHPQRVPHPGVLFDVEAVLSVGGYRTEDFPAEDLALWLRLAETGIFVGVPEVVVDWSMSQGSVTHTQQERQRMITARVLSTSFPLRQVERLTVDDVERELAAYKGTRLESVRQLLLARDLRSLVGLGVSRDAYIRSKEALRRSPLRSVSAIRQVAWEKWRRDRARRSLAPKSSWPV